MDVTYTDDQIAELIAEPKPIFMNQWRVTYKRSHREESMEIQGDAGNKFRIIRRINEIDESDESDFSIILGVTHPRTSKFFRLLRYDGNNHEHTNHIESTRIYDFHIHRATERYQKSIYPDDGYAEVTGRYTDIDGAFACIYADAGFYETQSRLVC